MNWWQTLIVALSTLVVTKGIDLFVSWFNEKREFNKYRREKVTDDIEALKNEIGRLFELAANWKSFEEKQRSYLTNFENDHELIGKFNKYPSIAQAARDTVHWCRIVASCEMKLTTDLIENKKELGEKFRKFLTTCDDYMNSIV
jgi:hypothetical protein